jgi:hypothetical protein
LQTLLGNGTIPVLAGMPYWVAVLPGDVDTWAGWDFNTSGVTGNMFFHDGSGWVLESGDENVAVGAFEVLGDSPEPGMSLSVSAAGILVLFGKLRRLS